jgi:hypothetical protein
MASVSQVETSLKTMMEECAQMLARQTGCIQRKRKFNGADLLQTLVFGWLCHPDASLETLASMAATREVSVTDTAIHERFTKPCAQFLHAVLEEMTSAVVHADQDVPIELLNRFSAVVLEDSCTVSLPDELLECWQGRGGCPGDGLSAVEPHVWWELKQGCLWGPHLTNGRTSDRSSCKSQNSAGDFCTIKWAIWCLTLPSNALGFETLILKRFLRQFSERRQEELS